MKLYIDESFSGFTEVSVGSDLARSMHWNCRLCGRKCKGRAYTDQIFPTTLRTLDNNLYCYACLVSLKEREAEVMRGPAHHSKGLQK